MTPPMRNVGLWPSRSSIVATSEEVVVLPWVPAHRMVTEPRERYESMRARCQTSTPSSRARTSSGLVSGMAEEMTTTSGETRSTVDALWPIVTSMPSLTRGRV